MKIRWHSILVAACAAAAISASADQVEVKGKVDTTPKDTSVDVRKTDNDATTRDHRTEVRAGVKASNKASGLLGMEVKNNEGEKLGEIKDLVVDLRTGKISYAVLAVGGFLGIGEKLLAVPPSAFTPAGDDHKLVLNADREKIRNAPGFVATSWPEVDNPSWGADGYWTPDKTRGAIITDRNANASVRTDVDTKKAEVNVHTDVDRDRDKTGAKLYADAKKDREARLEANGKSAEVHTSVDTDRDNRRDNVRRQGMTFEGQIKSVNPEERTLVVEGRDGTTKTFNFSSKPRITIARISDPTIADLRPGYQVQLGYHKDSDGKLVVHQVTKNDR